VSKARTSHDGRVRAALTYFQTGTEAAQLDVIPSEVHRGQHRIVTDSRLTLKVVP
jgi:hypothetical protein